MDTLTGECHFFNLEKVIFGRGKVAVLGDELARLGGRRTIIATGRSLGASPILDRVKAAMGDRFVGVFSHTAQHGADDSAELLATEMRRLDVDSIVSLGGGSPNDTAKVAVAAVLSGRTVEDMATSDILSVVDLGPVSRDIPHIALPTTLSAGEYSYGGGATNADGIKGAVLNPRLEVRVIINDPDLTVETPDILWASTGIRALDHMVEAFYSQHAQSFTDALATRGVNLLLNHLPPSLPASEEERLGHRGHCQTAAFLSNYAAINTRYGLSHAIGHKIGPKWAIPHGVTSGISLPHAMRFMASRVPERFEGLAFALGVNFDQDTPNAGAAACIAEVEQFIDSFGLPRSLSAVGVCKDQLAEVVDDIHHEVSIMDTIGSAASKSEISELLEAML